MTKRPYAIGRDGLLTQASDRASAGMEGSALLCRSRPWSNSLLITMVAGWRRNCAVLISRGGMIDALCFTVSVRRLRFAANAEKARALLK